MGTYDAPFATPLNQFSALLQIITPMHLPLLGNLQLTSSVATDQGDFLPQSTGAYISLRKTGSLAGRQNRLLNERHLRGFN